jgi:hypothetical protein
MGRATSEPERSPEAAPPELDPGQTVNKATSADDTDRAGNKEQQGEPGRPRTPQELSTEDELELRELKARDREVRAHEQAHVAAGGQYVTGGPSYEFERGPDGRQYAVGGEVNISVSPERDPEATIKKAQVIRRAALAPADPSSQDRQVASKASAMEREARAEMAKEATAPEGAQGSSGEPSAAEPRGAAEGGAPEAQRVTSFVAQANPYASLRPSSSLSLSAASGGAGISGASVQCLDLQG